MPIVFQNVWVTRRSPKDLGKVLCKCWPQSSVKFAMIIAMKASVRSSWLKYQELRIIMFKQQACMVNLTVVVIKALKIVGCHLLAILLVDHDWRYICKRQICWYTWRHAFHELSIVSLLLKQQFNFHWVNEPRNPASSMHHIYIETDHQRYKIYEVSVIISRINFLTMLQDACFHTLRCRY